MNQKSFLPVCQVLAQEETKTKEWLLSHTHTAPICYHLFRSTFVFVPSPWRVSGRYINEKFTKPVLRLKWMPCHVVEVPSGSSQQPSQ